MSVYEFEEEREYATLAEVVEDIAYFVGHPEYLLEPQIGYAS